MRGIFDPTSPVFEPRYGGGPPPAPLTPDQQPQFDRALASLQRNDTDYLTELLDDLLGFLTRFVIFPSDAAAVAVSLWVAHTWVVEAFDTSPRLAVLSAEKESGKTRLLEVLGLVCAQSAFTANVSVAALFRMIEVNQPTILLDEADVVFSPKASNLEELRAILNAGFRRGATVQRVVGEGKGMSVKGFPVFSPVALAGLGALPLTVISRSVVIRMRRRTRQEVIDQFRFRQASELAAPIAKQLEGWAFEAVDDLRAARPVMPAGIEDRAADSWEPLLAIADLAGSHWPTAARRAAVELHAVRSEEEPSMGVRLLADIYQAFAAGGGDRFASTELCQVLAAMPEQPWGDLFGKAIDPRALARRLRPFEIRSKQIRLEGDHRVQGFLVDDFRDAWARYLPTLSQERRNIPDEHRPGPEPGPASEIVRDSQPSLEGGAA